MACLLRFIVFLWEKKNTTTYLRIHLLQYFDIPKHSGLISHIWVLICHDLLSVQVQESYNSFYIALVMQTIFKSFLQKTFLLSLHFIFKIKSPKEKPTQKISWLYSYPDNLAYLVSSKHLLFKTLHLSSLVNRISIFYTELILLKLQRV